jgi:hypothetical protein
MTHEFILEQDKTVDKLEGLSVQQEAGIPRSFTAVPL